MSRKKPQLLKNYVYIECRRFGFMHVYVNVIMVMIMSCMLSMSMSHFQGGVPTGQTGFSTYMHMYEIYQVWYADDATGAATCRNLRSWWNQLVDRGPYFGYHPNASKTYLVVPTELG